MLRILPERNAAWGLLRIQPFKWYSSILKASNSCFIYSLKSVELNHIVKIEAKPRNKLTGVAIFFAVLFFLFMEIFFPISVLVTIMLYLSVLSFILWLVYFSSYSHVSYETREDGIYIIKNQQIMRNISYDSINKAQNKSGKIYISLKGAWRMDEILRPISDGDALLEEIKKRITK